MSLFRRDKRPALGRSAALAARPVRAPSVRVVDRPDGGVNVTVEVLRPSWQRLLGAGRHAERTFGLDAVGREVYEACDGKRTVARLVREFGRRRKCGRAESELAVTTFLETLVRKGLVVLAVPRRPGGATE